MVAMVLVVRLGDFFFSEIPASVLRPLFSTAIIGFFKNDDTTTVIVYPETAHLPALHVLPFLPF